MLTLLGHRGWAYLVNTINKISIGYSMSDSNKIVACIANSGSSQELYLDTAAELSKIDRKNHKQVTDKGVPLVYDLMVTVSAPLDTKKSLTNPGLLATGVVKTAPLNWQTRNSVRMAHFTREDLRKEAGVVKGSIGRYAKNLRCNLDPDMYAIPYNPSAPVAPGAGAGEQESVQRIYAQREVNINSVNILGHAGERFDGGTWDYTQLVQVKSGDANTADDFYLNVCESHSSAAPGPYDYVGILQSYNQRRQTTLDDSTLTSGGDTQFINNDSPFFRIPEQDVSEDEYVQITLDEQDAPPYDRSIGPANTVADSKFAQPADFFQLTDTQALASMRVQAPLGLVQFELSDLLGTFNQQTEIADNQFIVIEVECLGTYEM